MIPAFNCAEYLRATLQSVLEQDWGEDQMQIEVVDDCSSRDDPEAVVREVGKGRVGFFRQPVNGGAIRNFNTCIERSRGRWVHILHGDDLVNPGFYEQMSKALCKAPQRGVAVCRSLIVDEQGRELAVEPAPGLLPGLEVSLTSMYPHNIIRTPSIVVCRAVYEEVGGFREDLPHCADWEMWCRAISKGGCSVADEVLVRYRHFAANDTSRLMKTAENLRDRLRAMEYLKEVMPELDPELLRKACRETALEQAGRFWSAGDNESGSVNYHFFKEISTVSELLRFYLARPLLRLLSGS